MIEGLLVTTAGLDISEGGTGLAAAAKYPDRPFQLPDASETVLCKDPTDALIQVQHHCIHTFTMLHVSAPEGPSAGSTGTFCEQGQQNACPAVNIILKSSAPYVTWQLSHRSDFHIWTHVLLTLLTKCISALRGRPLGGSNMLEGITE